ncbi:hypothetical protein LTR01_008511 [Friedmanniomyces endolithicus]|nr:hypothetical protein LTR01_008511 [Friedmanniomyces endolithicus]KAK0827899.1 hypothetical protein LTR73_005501 [Friedmanniomyces endolithicus]
MAAITGIGTSSTRPKRPGKLAIAFALSVITSKPTELSVKEYIRLLCQHVARGRRKNAISSAHRFLDRSSHWRSEYERAKDAWEVAEGQAVELRMEVQRLKVRLESAKPAASALRKRKKAVDEDIVPVPRSPKKAKRIGNSGSRDEAAELGMESGWGLAEVGEIGNILMRGLYETYNLSKHPNRSEASVLAYHLVRTASALPHVVQQAIKTRFTQLSSGHEVLKTTLTAAGKVVVSLVVGLDRLSKATNGTEMQGQVVYAYVHMFVSLLGTLEEVSEFEVVEAQRKTSMPAAAKRPTTSKKMVSSRLPKQPHIQDTPSLDAIACFLGGVIDSLDENVYVHKHLYEGFAYVVLNKLGTRLYTSVFGDARGPTIADEITARAQPDGNQDAGGEPTISAPALKLEQVKMEAPYLVHLLTKVMAAAPRYLGAITSDKTGKAKQSDNKGSTNGALALHAKDRLQRTLVNCIFGTEGLDDEDPFMDCLRMPSMVGQLHMPMPKVKEAEVQDWFKGEVWRLLGWEILGKDGHW